ncbi:MAG: YibE/F family protein [Lachnospiraceae bacterium]|nr:YibE/F family protein [Lachnospiraceae bacterium]
MKLPKQKKSKTESESTSGKSLSVWLKDNRLNFLALFLCAVIFFCFYFYVQTGTKKSSSSEGQSSYSEYELATVVSITEDTTQPSEMFEGKYTGNQTLMVKIDSGQYKGMTMTAMSYLGALYGTPLSEGDPVVVSIYTVDNAVNSITVYEYNRTFHILLILGAFVAITVIIGRKKGLQSLLGLAFTVICLIFILIPLLMKGFPTLITTFCVCVYVAVVSFIFIGGVTKKSVCAMLGTFTGLGLAVIFGLLAQWLVKVDGMRMGEYVDALLQLKQKGTPIQLSGLLIGGMIISTLGAVMDVAMSISSAMQELTSVNSSLTRQDLWKSGMNIGRDMIGTMTNTLILAFAGSSFLMVLYIYSLGVPVYELLSSTLVATELVHGIASSIGVIVSVPLTVLIGTFFYVNDSDMKER